MVMPEQFVPLSEETGLILDLGYWVLDEACRELRGWIDRGLKGVVMAVNISAAQLKQPDFEQKIVAALERHRVPGGLLELEITENVLMQDMEQAVSKLQRLCGWGVRIAVDDFGIGYSSLGYLQALPLNTLKIDRSFISEIQTPDDKNSIITAVFAMSRELALDVVAEGVENDGQLEFLRQLGCSKAQGFLLGRPVPAESARQLLQQQLAS
jgi:EAL domain-containing protein (putative c-di-GMP-specific phosphodiesterase class I)